MPSIPTFTRHLTLGLVASLALMLTSRPLSAQTPPPTKLAVVNIVKVFSSLDEKSKGDKELEDLAKQLNDDKNAKQKAAEDARTYLESLKPDGHAYVDAQDDLLHKAVELESYSRYMEKKLQIEQRLKTIRIYKHINDAIATMCVKRGIALVLVTDELSLGNAQSQAELLSQVSLRKVMYADPSLDITKDVITQLNSAQP